MVDGLLSFCLTVLIRRQAKTFLINFQTVFEVALLAAM